MTGIMTEKNTEKLILLHNWCVFICQMPVQISKSIEPGTLESGVGDSQAVSTFFLSRTGLCQSAASPACSDVYLKGVHGQRR